MKNKKTRVEDIKKYLSIKCKQNIIPEKRPNLIHLSENDTLSTIDLSNFDTRNIIVTDMKGMFHNCTNINILGLFEEKKHRI